VRSQRDVKNVLVIVEEDQLSLAIGKDGQNVRLASRLTGWDIELVSARDLEQRERLQEQLLMSIDDMVGVTEKIAEKLRDIGVNTVQKLVKTSREVLLEAPGLGPKSVDKLLATAAGTVEELENALEEMIRKENEDREREKLEAKPLFDESILEGGDEVEPSVKLTEEALFSDPVSDDEEPSAETTEAAAETEDAAETAEMVEQAGAADADETAPAELTTEGAPETDTEAPAESEAEIPADALTDAEEVADDDGVEEPEGETEAVPDSSEDTDSDDEKKDAPA
jgi:N utilization substance protein A